MNRLETFLMNNFDTDIQEVKEFPEFYSHN